MKKRSSKLRKILLRTLLLLVFFSSMVAVLTRNKFVQTEIAQYLTGYLSKELGTKVSVKAVEIDFLRNYHLEDLLILDKHNDTIFYAKTFNANMAHFSLRKRKIDLKDIELNKMAIHIGIYKNEKVVNYQFIEDYFKSSDTTSESAPWKINIKNIQLVDANFTQFDFRPKDFKNIPGEYNANYLAIRNINGQIPEWFIDKKGGNHFQLKNLSATERSGVRIESLSADCIIDDTQISLEKMRLELPNSVIGPKFSMTYKDFTAMDKPFTDVIYSLKLRNSKICLSDISAFAPWLKNRNFVLDVNADIKGPLCKIQSNYFNAKTKNGTVLNLKYVLKGLPEVPTLFNGIEFKQSTVFVEDIITLIPEIELPKTVLDLGYVKLNGALDLPMGLLHWDGEIKTDKGNLAGVLDLDYSKEKDPMGYNLDVTIDSVNWNHFLPEAAFLGKANMDVKLKGKGFDDKALIEYDIATSSYSINQRRFEKASINGILDHGLIDGTMVSEDPSASFTIDYLAENIFKSQHSVVDAKIGNLDFNKLGFDSVGTSFKGEIHSDLTGSDLNTILGEVLFTNCQINRASQDFMLATQLIRRKKLDKVEFTGNWIDGFISGNWKLGKTGLWVEQILHEMAPARFAAAKEKCTDSVAFDLFLFQTVWLDALVAPGLRLGPVSIVGNYNGLSNKYNSEIGPFSLEYGLFTSEKTRISIHKDKLIDNTAEFTFLSNQSKFDNTLYDKIEISAGIGNDFLSLKTHIHEKENRYSLDLAAFGKINENSADFNLDKSDLRIFSTTWMLDRQANILFNPEKINISNFYLSDNTHYLEVKGDISRSNSDTLRMDFSNITPEVLKPFLPKGSLDSLEFKANGDVKICAVLGNPRFIGEVGVNKIKYNRFQYGDMDLSIKETGKVGFLQMNCLFRSGPLKTLALNGSLQVNALNGSDLDIYGELPRKTPIQILQPFLTGIVGFKEGYLRGNFHLFGTTENPKAEGLISIEQARMKVDYLGTEYTTSGNIKVTEKGLFTVRPLKIFDDSKKNFAWMKLAFTYKNFSEFGLDLQVDSLKNFRVLQTTEKDNSLFYGNAWADGNCRMYGPLNQINMDINLKPRKNSLLSIQYSSGNENTISGAIVFRNHLGKIQATSVKKETPNSMGKINMNITATPEAEVQFVIDKKLGDIIKGRGNGQLRLVYDLDKKFYMFGSFFVEQGEYSFSLPGINLLKRISLDKGGSIVWDGDPFNATVDLVGRIEKKISPSTLMITSVGAKTSYPATKIISLLTLKGNLFSPSIGFDIQAPDLSSTGGTSANEVNSVIQRIRSDKDETMRQAVALLLFGNFIPPSFSNSGASATSNFSGSGFAGNSVSMIASSVVNDLFSKYGIPTRIQVNIDDVRNSTGTSNTKLFLNTEWFLSDRLRLDLNYDPTVAVLVSSAALPINFNLEYKTTDENWRIKAFSRSNNLLLQQNGSSTTNGVSGNTLGTGIMYRKEFETFKRKKTAPNPIKN